ncbi:cyclin-dependent kinase G-2-like [Stegodyphus dumicola]|uniref:cyclin-dependent kinase G-2-like n=1 Tax=Stegodyphus dumicola TaxID=202533 RepID=UPI0015B105D6|nr:cyclin-dependent kinase G-2-like [Stegodyphus dumicola]
MQKLLCGLEYIHDKKFMHRNLNPGCIFFDKNSELKIANFEHGRMMPAGYVPSEVKAVRNYLATAQLSEENNTGIDICYLAPEILLLSEDHTTAVDIWSAGCIFAELLLKEKVFDGTKDTEVLSRIFYTLGMPNDEIWPGWSKLPGLDLYKIENCNEYNYIRKIFCQQSENCINLLNAMFLYYPKARYSAKKCLQLDYFKEEPRGPPLDLKEIFEALKTGIKRPSSKSSSSCYYSSTK